MHPFDLIPRLFGSAVLAQPRGGFLSRMAVASLTLGFSGIVAAAPVVETLVEFQRAPTNASGALAQGDDGNFYGTTQSGGTSNCGTVFRLSPAGALTTLVSFTGTGGRNRGSGPVAALARGIDGNFYGTTYYGGPLNYGTAFRVTPAGVLTTLVDFTSNGTSNRGSYPAAALVQGSDGNFYGSTSSGGSNYGTLFRLTPAGVLTTLVDFNGGSGPNSGGQPSAALVQGTDGNLYGNTRSGGNSDGGTVFSLTLAGQLTTLASLGSGGTSGQPRNPAAALALGTDGNFYGTSYSGGASSYGTAYRVTPAGEVTVLVQFTGMSGANRGAQPASGLVRGSDGNFYGTTERGGTAGFGTIFRLAPDGTLTTLVDFTGPSGGSRGTQPSAGLALGTDGNFYGITQQGGASGNGTAFRITPVGTLSTLADLPVDADTPSGGRGSQPAAALVVGTDGNFYGTTYYGGALNYGTAFRLTPGGVLTTLVEFTGNGASNRGRHPAAALVPGPDGSLYGSTFRGGAFDLGTFFRITPAGELTTLVDLAGYQTPNRGCCPTGALVLGADGNFYGTTGSDLAYDRGTIIRLTPAGVLTTLADLSNNFPDRGNNPRAALAQGTDGNFYGSAYGGGTSGVGTIFRVTPAGALSVLVNFTGSAPSYAGGPSAALVPGPDGNFYGTTDGSSTIFRLTPAGALTTLFAFGNYSNGSALSAGLALGADGNFYGAARFGGASGAGRIFRVTLDGAFTPLVDFTGADGANLGRDPAATLVRGADGKFYGITTQGGASDGGTIYRLRFEPDGTTTQLVSVAVEPANGTRLRWKTAAGQVSRVEISVDLTGAWKPLGTVTANASGLVEYLDTAASTQRLYRLVTPP